MTRANGRPIILLVVWAALLGICAALAPLVQDTAGLPYDVLSLVMLAPAIASVIVIVRPAWFPHGWRAVGIREVTLSAIFALVAVAVFAVVLSASVQRLPSVSFTTGGVPFLAWFAIQPIGVLAEEVGWRGVVQRAGEQLARPTIVSAIAGFLFGVTHLGYWGSGLVPVLTFGFAAALMSLTITTIFRGSLFQRMLPAVIIHLGMNLAIGSLAESGEALATSPAVLIAAASMFVVAIVARFLTARRDLPSAPRTGPTPA